MVGAWSTIVNTLSPVMTAATALLLTPPRSAVHPSPSVVGLNIEKLSYGATCTAKVGIFHALVLRLEHLPMLLVH
jgi:hypothetical protein